jgi:ribulose-phosphate 3-epimerase
MEAVVIPAILVKSRQELLDRIARVRGLVREIQLDIMDGVFVPNKTIGLEELKGLPEARYEFHWMVMEPEKWIGHVPGPHMHLVHVETITDFAAVEEAVKKAGGMLGLALNPETPLEKLLPYVNKAKRVLVMTVRPGYSGQKYIYEMEHKVRALREMFPKLDIEVDGGVNNETVPHAYSSGANLLAAASAIFSQEDVKSAIEHLKKKAMAGCHHGAH